MNYKEKNKEKKNKKGFLNIFRKQLFYEEPKNRDELILLIKNFEKNSLISKNTRNILEKVIQTTKKRVKEVMVPKLQMVTIKSENNLYECLEIIFKSYHSKFPVINKKKKIKGFVTIKDFIPFIKNKKKRFSIKKILKPLIIIPESKYVDIALYELKSKKLHMAIVIDEFGTVSGLITIKDILKLIIGEIKYKFNNINKSNIIKKKNKNFIVKGLTKISDFNSYFKTNFKDSEVDTIGGLILKYFGKLPKIGEKIQTKNFYFKIIETNSIRIIKMKIKKIKN
ncbi:transporter associated domain-containing protein [Buchnera aphidicola (Pseudoregma panicola)]|uniref:transporter associated domain-containing protein n=1 Tax=Buchnera aphidicola TaxID=9 RepID=UPI0031B69EEE